VVDETYVAYPIDDVPWIEEPDAIHELGNRVAELVRTNHRVVVNCMSGMNRSGLLVGRALVALGHPPIEAVELIRRARGPHALSNREFTRFLLIDCTPRKLAALNERGPCFGPRPSSDR
jgi:protein-tyrosine phosphatase